MITINGVEFSKGITNLAISTIDITEASRNAVGTMFIDLIATKDKLEIEFKPMTQEEMKKLLVALEPITFSVAYTNAKGDRRIGTFYKGDRVTPILCERNGKRYYDRFKISLIEC